MANCNSLLQASSATVYKLLEADNGTVFVTLRVNGNGDYLTVAFGVNVWFAMSMPGAVRWSAGEPLVKQRLWSTDSAHCSSDH